MPLQSTNSAETTTRATRENIDAIVKLEENFVRDRTLPDRIADAIGSFTGSLKFVALHAALYGTWIVINLGWIPGIRKFDPFPFMLLGTIVSLEAIFLSTFVLMKQNRMGRREDLRAHLDLQINLLSEREMTMVLQILQQISARLGIRPPGEQIRDLSETTSIEALASNIRDALSEE